MLQSSKIAATAVKTLPRQMRGIATTAVGLTYEQALSCSPNTEVTVLGNGVRVATQVTPSAASTVGVYIDAGSRFESASNNGISNFIEHLVYKSPAAKGIDKIGGLLSASTGRELVGYTASTSSSDAAAAVGVLGDSLKSINTSDKALDAARSEVYAQMHAFNADMEAATMEQLHLTAFQGTALGRPILGPTANVAKFTAADVSSYISSNYTGNRIVIAASGDVKHSDIVSAAEKATASVATGDGDILVDPPRYTGSEIRYRDDTEPIAYLAIGFEAVGASNADFMALSVAKEIIGDWDYSFQFADNRASAMTTEFINDKSTYQCRGFNLSYSDTGLFGTYMVGGNTTIDDSLFEVQNEYMRMCTALTPQMVMRGKAALKGNLLRSNLGSANGCDDIGRQVLAYGRHMSTAELIARVDAVTLDQVKNVMYETVYDVEPAVSAIGCIEAVPEYNRIRSGQYWARY